MNVTFSKLATYNGTKQISVEADVRNYGFAIETLRLEYIGNGQWDIVRPSKNDIYTTSNQNIGGGQTYKIFGTMPLRFAKENAEQLVKLGLWDK